MANSRPKVQEIKVGWKDGQWIEVAQGLEEGQLVLLEVPDSKNREP